MKEAILELFTTCSMIRGPAEYITSLHLTKIKNISINTTDRVVTLRGITCEGIIKSTVRVFKKDKEDKYYVYLSSPRLFKSLNFIIGGVISLFDEITLNKFPKRLLTENPENYIPIVIFYLNNEIKKSYKLDIIEVSMATTAIPGMPDVSLIEEDTSVFGPFNLDEIINHNNTLFSFLK